MGTGPCNGICHVINLFYGILTCPTRHFAVPGHEFPVLSRLRCDTVVMELWVGIESLVDWLVSEKLMGSNDLKQIVIRRITQMSCALCKATRGIPS